MVNKVDFVNTQNVGPCLFMRDAKKEISAGFWRSHFGAKSDFEIWAFEVFFGPEKRPQGRLVGAHT